MNKIDMERIKNIHLIGIGGCGMSAIGKVLHQMGFRISGSDIKESSNTIRLTDMGIQVYIGHNKDYIRDADLVVYSTAIPKDNAELLAAEASNVPIQKRAEMLSWIMSRFNNRVAVAGTHGKTTTTSMISKILFEGGLDPTYLIGGETDYVDGNARLGKGSYAVAEADESDGSFIELSPNISIITNIEPDHMDFFGTPDNLYKVFIEFISKLEENGLLILGIDNPACRGLLNKIKAKRITYGLSQDADLRAINLIFDGMHSKFDVYNKGKLLGEARLSIPGEQNVENALAAFAVGLEAGLSFGSMTSILHSFSGAKRRFQIIGEADGVTVIDDYAHHPTEIKSTLKAIRLGWEREKRVICVFQPHRYTRTLHLATQFGEAFNEADIVILTDIYSAGEDPIPNVDGKLLMKEVQNRQEVIYVQRKEKIAELLLSMVKPNDIVITMGAGDIHTVGKEFLSRLKIKKDAA